MTKLKDDELEMISGGFREENIELKGISYGMNIKCPVCGADGKADFRDKVYVDTKMRSAEYTCRKGHSFVCCRGQIIMKDDFIKECLNHNHVYKNV